MEDRLDPYSKSPLAIPFVRTADGRHLAVETLSPAHVIEHALSSDFHRCGFCLDPVSPRGGLVRRFHFCHRVAREASPPCPWRSDSEAAAFFERNYEGGDGAWHVLVQQQLLHVLTDLMTVPAERNAYVRGAAGIRRPDVRTTLNGRIVNFEIQSSATNLATIRQRSERDFYNGETTIWIVNCNRYSRHLENNDMPAWIDDLSTYGGGQVWLWDQEVYARSCRESSLWLKRAVIGCADLIQQVQLVPNLPQTYSFRYHLNARNSGALYLNEQTPVDNEQTKRNIIDLHRALHTLAGVNRAKANYMFWYEYGDVRLNAPFPVFKIASGLRRGVIKSLLDPR